MAPEPTVKVIALDNEKMKEQKTKEKRWKAKKKKR